MTNQDHIDQIVNLILKSRKMEPSKIEAFSKLVAALSQVKEKAPSAPNIVKEEEDSSIMPDNTMIDLSKDINVQFGEDGPKHKITIIPN